MVHMTWAEGTGALEPPEDTFTDEGLAAAMDRWNERVKRDVPADRLLVWEPREGWGAAVRVPRSGGAQTSRSRT